MHLRFLKLQSFLCMDPNDGDNYDEDKDFTPTQLIIFALLQALINFS